MRRRKSSSSSTHAGLSGNLEKDIFSSIYFFIRENIFPCKKSIFLPMSYIRRNGLHGETNKIKNNKSKGRTLLIARYWMPLSSHENVRILEWHLVVLRIKRGYFWEWASCLFGAVESPHDGKVEILTAVGTESDGIGYYVSSGHGKAPASRAESQ